MAALTFGGIIDLALDQAGVDTSYKAKARNWLNYIINTLCAQNNYRFYNKNASAVPFITNQKSYSLPADFDKADTCYRLNSDGSIGTQIFLLEPYRFDQYNRNLSGDPTIGMIDTQAGTIVFNSYPSSSTATSYQLRYFRKPANYALDGSQDTSVPDFPDQTVLVEQLMKMVYENLDDQRYGDKKGDALDAQKKLQRNQFQESDTQVVDLSHEKFVKRWRR